MKTIYELRITYLTKNGRAKVRTIRDLEWIDVAALLVVLENDPSTLRTEWKSRVIAWSK